jgi:hypothetical protein
VLDSPTQITATVPAGAAAYPTVRWRVHWPVGGVAIHGTPFTVVVPPAATVASFAPASGFVGSQVVLTGTNFVDVAGVTFGNVAAAYTVDSPTRITATVPAGLARDAYRWRVTTTGGTAVNDALFPLTAPPPPTIAAAAPASGWIGTTVTLTGAHFRDVRSVTLGGIAATYDVVSPEEITAVVPWGASALDAAQWRVETGDHAVTGDPYPIVLPAASAAWADEAGDVAAPLPDVTAVRLENDAAGLLRWEIDVPAHPVLTPDVVLLLFLVNSPNGAGYVVVVRGSDGTVDLARIPGESALWDYDVPATTLRASWSSGAVIEIDRRELGWTEGMRFAVLAASAGQTGFDTAPSELGSLAFALGTGAVDGGPLPLPTLPLEGAGGSPAPLDP